MSLDSIIAGRYWVVALALYALCQPSNSSLAMSNSPASSETILGFPTEKLAGSNAKSRGVKLAAEEKPTPQLTEPAETKDQIFRINIQAIGCQNAQMLERLVTYVTDGDKEAFLEMMAVSIAAGECITLRRFAPKVSMATIG